MAESYLKEIKRQFRDYDRNLLDSRPSERTWDVWLKYRYRVNGCDFTGQAMALRQPKKDNRWDEAQAVKESYRAGDALPVFYKPADASKSRLTLKEPGIPLLRQIPCSTIPPPSHMLCPHRQTPVRFPFCATPQRCSAELR